MHFLVKADTVAVQTADSGKIRLGGACRLPLSIAGAGKQSADTGRKPLSTADSGKIRLGGACRLPLTNA